VGLVAMGSGFLLIVLGVGFYFGTDRVSPTALIPAAFGLVLVVLGMLARQEKLRKHVMHAGAAVGLIGIIIPLVRLWPALEQEKYSIATELGLMAAICAGFVVLCVRSFVAARRNRTSSRPE
jgi:uncharacterized membrane protein